MKKYVFLVFHGHFQFSHIHLPLNISRISVQNEAFLIEKVDQSGKHYGIALRQKNTQKIEALFEVFF